MMFAIGTKIGIWCKPSYVRHSYLSGFILTNEELLLSYLVLKLLYYILCLTLFYMPKKGEGIWCLQQEQRATDIETWSYTIHDSTIQAIENT